MYVCVTAGITKEPVLTFNTHQQRFDQRFANFHTLTRPEPLHYSQFVESLDTSGHAYKFVLQLAFDSFKAVRALCGAPSTLVRDAM